MARMVCSVSVMVNLCIELMSTGISPVRVGSFHTNLCRYRVFECANGQLIIADGNNCQFCRLFNILKLEALSNDPLFLINKQRVLNRDQLTVILSDAIKLFSKDDLLKLCEDNNVPAGPINTMEEVFKDPQVIFREMMLNFEGVQGVASPFKFSDAKLNMRVPSPKLGQDDGEF